MAAGKVQLVREAFRCFDSGDWEKLRTLIAPDAVMTPLEIWPDPGPFIGPEASIREYQRLFQLFRGIEVSVNTLVGHDEWAVAHYRGAGAESEPGLPDELEFTGVHRFENDLFAESHYRLDRDTALAAAGL
jgi:ketosteroid isomerase-like protein